MEKVLDYLSENWIWIAPIILEIGTRLIRTEKNLSILDNALKLIAIILPNRSTKQTTLSKDYGVKKITGRHIVKIVALLLISLPSYGQIDYTGKQFNSINADSITVRTRTQGLEVLYGGGNVGTIYYNTVTKKWRKYINTTTTPGGGVWSDFGSGGGGGGGGNVTGTFVAPRVPYASGANSLTDKSTFSFIAANDRLQVPNIRATRFRTTTDSVFANVSTAFFKVVADSVNARVQNGSNQAFVKVSNQTVAQAGTGTQSARFIVQKDNISIATSNNPSFGGIKYDNDYSINYTTRSLIDKGYGDATYIAKTLTTGNLLVGVAGTATPLAPGANGTFLGVVGGVPTYTSVPGGITNSSATNELPRTGAGSNLVSSGIEVTAVGSLNLGLTGTTGALRTFTAQGSATDVGFNFVPKGGGQFRVTNANGSSIVHTDVAGNITQWFAGSQMAVTPITPNSEYQIAAQPTSSGNRTDLKLITSPVSGTSNGGNITIQTSSGSGAANRGGDIILTLGTSSGAPTRPATIIISNIPTSSAGLPSGALWSNAGVLTIVP